MIKNQILQSKQMGRRENKFVNFEGRVPFDLLLVIIIFNFKIINNAEKKYFKLNVILLSYRF